MKYFWSAMFVLLLSGSHSYLYNHNAKGEEQKFTGGTIDSTLIAKPDLNAPEFIGGNFVAEGIIVPDIDSLPYQTQSDSVEPLTLRLKDGTPVMEPMKNGK